MNSIEQSLAPTSAAPLVSRRLYNGLCFALLTVSFAVMFLIYTQVASGALDFLLDSHLSIMLTFAGAFAGTMGGLTVMGAGKKRQSLAISLVGYTLFTLTFGLTLAIGVSQYTTQTIGAALGITCCLTGIFMIAGITFPEFFSSIGHILSLSLIALIAVELVVTMFLHVGQTFFDFATITIFCGFIGYDTYRLAVDDPTVSNAIWHACDIYIDITNILLRVLDLLDRS